MKMLDVGAKPKTERLAVARGFVAMDAATLEVVRSGTSEKGDVLAAARLAGIMAAKHTPDLIPLCHPISLSAVEVEAAQRPGGIEILATVRTVDRTGVEMEALAAVSAGCLTVYDMLKRYERGMRIVSIELLEKKGGRSGHWLRTPEQPGPRLTGASGRVRSRAGTSRSQRRRGG